MSMLDRRSIETAYFRDAYRIPLRHPDAGMVDIFFGLFGHHPWWMKAALIARNKVAALCGLHGAAASETLHFERKPHYAAGDKIGVWPIHSLTGDELIAGRDDKHLDFRLSVLRERNGTTASVTVSTVCVTHNRFGKVYLFFVIPFHKWGVRKLLSNAMAAGRL